jgi:cytochrome oxidase Cu insertion factor (SCO1/SenC/PrrC family)
MTTSAVKYWVLLALILGAVYGAFVYSRRSSDGDGSRGTPAASSSSAKIASRDANSAAAFNGPVAPFKLIDQDGKEFDSSSLKGKVWVASFFFTNCPAICWRMNQVLAAWQHQHPNADVHFVSITCDPDNDTPEALKRYAEHFKADPKRWTFLTGDMKSIQAIGQESFKVAVVKGDHTDRACVVDRQGQIRGRFRLTEPDQAEMLDRLLAVVESESPAASEPTSEAVEPPVETTAAPATESPAAN